MFKKISNTQLIIRIIILLLIVGGIYYWDSRSGEKTFKTELVEIDSAKVTSIFISPKDNNYKEIKLLKRDNDWRVEMEGKKSMKASIEMVVYVIKELQKIKSKRLAATEENKWKEFQVDDSSGTKVKVMEGNNLTLSIIIGKFSYLQDPNQMQMQGGRGGEMLTYVRLAEEKNVYVTEGFLSMTFNRDYDNWIDKTIIKSDFNNWTKISFAVPDSSLTLSKQNEKWFINGNIETDSTKVENYLQSIANLNADAVMENVNAAQLGKSIFSLNIETSLKQNIIVNAYPSDSVNHFILTSNQNPEIYFSSKNKIHERIFVGKEKFLRE